MPVMPYGIYIYSNDGSTLLKSVFFEAGGKSTLTVNADGVTISYTGGSSTYTYSGSGTFLGLSNVVNSSTPTIDIGGTFSDSGTSGTNFTFYIVEEEPTPPTRIKSPVVVIKQKVKQVIVDNVNMTIDIYTKEVPATEATVTITNTATNSKYTAYINDNEYIVGPNSSITITVPIGTTLEFAGLDVTSGMGYWTHTSSTGEITHDSSPYMTYTINGSGTITGYIYDAD